MFARSSMVRSDSDPRPAAREASWNRRVVLLVTAGVATIALWLAGLPGHASLPNWFYPIRARSLDPDAWALALALALPALAIGVDRAAARRRHALAASLLVLTSLAAQASSLALIGPPLATALERFEGGHAAFLVAAHDQRRDAVAVAHDYPAEVEAGRLGDFAKSKPPGTYAFYAALVSLSRVPAIERALAPIRSRAEARPRLRRLASAVAVAVVAFPLVTALVVLPLLVLGASVGGDARHGYDAALLWASCPAVLVITHHTDGSLYPLLLVSAAALGAAGARRDSIATSACGGALAGVGVWCSYGLLPGVALVIAMQWAAILRGGGSRRHSLSLTSRAARHASALLGGTAATLAALVAVGLFPEPIEGYRRAIEHHRAWKLELVGGRWGLTGAAELWAWAGLVLLVSFLVATIAALPRAPLERSRASLALAALLVLGVHVVLMLYAGSNESARLWLFELPFFAVVAAIDLRRDVPRARPGLLVSVAVAVQLAAVPVIRAMQPW